jgi:myxalamid-type polyketide synthase MxaD
MSSTPNHAGDAQLVKQALVALRQARQKLDAMEQARKEPVAIIGMACRFPGGANSPEEFWKLLEGGVDAISQVPGDRWDVDEVFDPDPAAPGKLNSRWGGFIDPIDQFDAGFFGISPREAIQMDPQQRLTLEVAWEAIENAGLTKADLAGSGTGVYIGVHSHSADYALRQYADPQAIDIYTGTGTAHNVIAGRLAYLFDLRGPSVTIDTACSSSLVAVHLASQSLRAHESEMALVGGVNLILSPEFTIAASKMHMLAPDGRCKAFDAQANGFVRGEGCAVVVLKRLSDALAHGDNILALIRGSAINQDGRTNGLTAPNGLSQQQVIRQALENADIKPSEVGYIEAHGTGTSLGDVIELDALGAIFDRSDRNGGSCFLGSAKSNIGHLEGAAGIAGLIKAVLSLQKKKFPAIVHFKNLNPNISLDHTALVVPDALKAWEASTARIAGVSSFGWSGTNAHAVLSEAPRLEAENVTDSGNYLLPLSANSPQALHDLANSYSNFLEQKNTSSLFDICYTASCRRTHHSERIAFAGTSANDLAEKMRLYLREQPSTGPSRITADSKVVFVFPGQGSQWLGMGRELFKQNQAFRELLEQCDKAIHSFAGWSLIEQLTLDEDSPNCRLNEISVIQPALFALEIALSAVWRSWGVEPQAVIGHSMGEVAAAYVAGGLSLADAVQIICTRSQLMQRTSGRGAMVVVGLSISEATEFIKGFEDKVSIAVNNSPRSTVLSGDPQALEQIMNTLAAGDVFCRPVKVDVASHSPQMDPLRPELVASVQNIKPQATHIPFFSTVTGEICDRTTLDAKYWGRNLRQPVQFGSAIQKLMETDHSVFIEMSPHPILLASIQEVANERGKPGYGIASLRRGQPELTTILTELGSLYQLGYSVDWKRLYPSSRRIASLPTYSWQHEKYWLEVESSPVAFVHARAGAKASEHSVLGREMDLAVQRDEWTWEFDLSAKRFPYLYEHKLQELEILAASHYLEAALAAMRLKSSEQPARVQDVEFQRPLILPRDHSAAVMQFHLAATEEKDSYAFEIFSRSDQAWIKHVVGKISTPHANPQPDRLEDIKKRLTTEINGDAFYAKLEKDNIQIGGNTQTVARLWYRPSETLSLLETRDPAISTHQLELVILDGCFQLSATATPGFWAGDDSAGDIYVPSRLDQVQVYRDFNSRMLVHVKRRDETETSSESLIEDIRLYDENGQIAAEILGVHLQKLEAQNQGGASQDVADWLYQIQWQTLPHNSADRSESSEPGLWLIFTDQRGVGTALAEKLKEQGNRCVLVSLGKTVNSPNEHYVLDPQNVQDMQQLLESILDPDSPSCQGIVHLWSLDIPPIAELDSSVLEAEQVFNCSSVLYLVRALAQQEWKERPRLWLVTQGAQPVIDSQNGQISPVQAALWGFGRVIAKEHPELWGGLIDLDPAEDADHSGQLLGREATMPDHETELAFRSGERYVARLVRLPRSISNPSSFHWRADSSYLITGGLGDIGSQVVQWMVRQGARRLILMGRTPLPPRSEWKQVDQASSVGRKVALIQSLEALGASVHLAAVDVADEEQLAKFVETFRDENWPPIRGVIHTAATIEDNLLLNLDTDALRSVLRSKAIGAWSLHRLFKDLDCFVMFSSLGSLLGQAGQSNYAAANAFLDALAYYRQGQNKAGLSINWGAWRGLGFAATSGGQRTILQLEAEGMSSFAAEDGLKAMMRILQGNQPQVVVTPANWAVFNQAHKDDPTPVSPLVSDLTSNTGMDQFSEVGVGKKTREVSFHERLLDAPSEEQYELLEAYIQDQVAHALRMPASRIGADQALGTLGLESLMAIELRNRLEADLKLKLSATLIWNYPTIHQLTTYLAGKLNLSQVSQLPENNKVVSPESRPQPAREGKTFTDVNELSDEEIMQSLLQGKGNRND